MNIEFKGTPSPWYEDKIKGHVYGGNNRSVASCMGYSTNMDNGNHIKESYANAKLISVAPELLKSLSLLVSICETGLRPLSEDLEKSRSIINQALDND